MIRHLFTALLFVCLTLAVPAMAQEKILDVQSFKSPTGIEIWLVQDRTVPVIAMNFSFEGGLALEPDSKPGTARLVSLLLDEGAGEMDSQAFQSKMQDNAIHIGFTPGRDAFYGQMKTLAANKDIAVDLLYLALNKPRFDEDAVTRMKNANISQIRDDIGDPGWLSARTFNGMTFEGHPYSRPGHGTLASMEAITRKDIAYYAREQFARNLLKVSIAGDVTRQQAADMVDRIFGGLPDKTKQADVPEARVTNGSKTILLPLDTPQTYIVVGSEGIPRNDKDWHAAVVMNHILGGGGFDSRLMREIREKRGLTYGVYTAISSMRRASLIQANMSASNENVEEALRLLRTQWADVAANGVTPEELADAKAYLTGSLFLELTSTDDIAGTLNGLQRDNLGPQYINERNAAIGAVTQSDIARVAKRLLKPETLVTVLVGQPKNIKVDILLDQPPGMDSRTEAKKK